MNFSEQGSSLGTKTAHLQMRRRKWAALGTPEVQRSTLWWRRPNSKMMGCASEPWPATCWGQKREREKIQLEDEWNMEEENTAGSVAEHKHLTLPQKILEEEGTLRPFSPPPCSAKKFGLTFNLPSSKTIIQCPALGEGGKDFLRRPLGTLQKPFWRNTAQVSRAQFCSHNFTYIYLHKLP